VKALGGITRCCIAVGELDQAKHFLAQVPAAKANDPAIAGARAQLELAEAGQKAAGQSQELRARVDANPKGFRGALRPGAGFVRRRRPRGGVDQLLEIIHANRLERRGGAQGLVKFFEAMGPTDPLTPQRAAAPPSSVQLGADAARPDLARSPSIPAIARCRGAADLSADRAVLLPGGRLPLNIFEPRYLAMTRHPAAADAPHRHGAAGGTGADRNPIPPSGRQCSAHRLRRPHRLVPGNEEGRLRHHVERPDPFTIRRELPIARGRLPLVEPDFAPFAEDMAERDFEMAAKAEFHAAFKGYVETKQLKVDWDAIKGAPDDHLLVSLAMLSPFSPEEKQSLLECADLAQLAAMMTALFELAVANRQSPDRILH
jgi:Lon protease-like protein